MKTVNQRTRGNRPNLRKSVLALFRCFDFAAQLSSHRLHAVTDTQNRAIQIKYFSISTRCIGLCDCRRAARQNDTSRLESFYLADICIKRQDFTVHVQFTDAPSNQLCVLRTEIQNQNSLGMRVAGVRHQTISQLWSTSNFSGIDTVIWRFFDHGDIVNMTLSHT